MGHTIHRSSQLRLAVAHAVELITGSLGHIDGTLAHGDRTIGLTFGQCLHSGGRQLVVQMGSEEAQILGQLAALERNGRCIAPQFLIICSCGGKGFAHCHCAMGMGGIDQNSVRCNADTDLVQFLNDHILSLTAIALSHTDQVNREDQNGLCIFILLDGNTGDIDTITIVLAKALGCIRLVCIRALAQHFLGKSLGIAVIFQVNNILGVLSAAVVIHQFRTGQTMDITAVAAHRQGHNMVGSDLFSIRGHSLAGDGVAGCFPNTPVGIQVHFAIANTIINRIRVRRRRSERQCAQRQCENQHINQNLFQHKLPTFQVADIF